MWAVSGSRGRRESASLPQLARSCALPHPPPRPRAHPRPPSAGALQLRPPPAVPGRPPPAVPGRPPPPRARRPRATPPPPTGGSRRTGGRPARAGQGGSRRAPAPPTPSTCYTPDYQPKDTDIFFFFFLTAGRPAASRGLRPPSPWSRPTGAPGEAEHEGLGAAAGTRSPASAPAAATSAPLPAHRIRYKCVGVRLGGGRTRRALFVHGGIAVENLGGQKWGGEIVCISKGVQRAGAGARAGAAAAQPRRAPAGGAARRRKTGGEGALSAGAASR